MPKPPLYPLKLHSALHAKVWGGRALAERLRKRLPGPGPYGESWELHDTSRVLNGKLRGKSLAELLRDYSAELIGETINPSAGFPLLAKFIDASDWLSIQVHPNDEQALALEGEPRGKTEAWVIIQADPGAKLVIGVKPGNERTQLEAAILQGRLETLLQFAQVQAGDVLYIPANTIHALGPGLLIYEIQQSSDITYRLYDWGRLGLDGQPRELHIEKGMQVSDLNALPQIQQPAGDLLVDEEYFRTWRHALRKDSRLIKCEKRFQALTCISGKIEVEAEGHELIAIAIGETGLIPACINEFSLSGEGVILRSCQR